MFTDLPICGCLIGAPFAEHCHSPSLLGATASSAPPALIPVGAQDLDHLEGAVVEVEQAEIQTSCETRSLWGRQAHAFSVTAHLICRLVC